MSTAAERSKRFRERHPGYYQTPERVAAQRASTNRRRQDSEVRAERVDKERERRYNRLYGITVADYDRMLTAQDGGRALCGETPGNL